MIKLFTHTDLDGIGCAVLAKIAFCGVSVSYCNYDDINEEVSKFIAEKNNFDMCHITDISITDELAKTINEEFDNFYLLDHHPTALYLNKYNYCTVKIEDEETQIKTSGTELYYKWLVENGYLRKTSVLDRFVELVKNYDTWRWSILGDEGVICKQVNDLLYLYGRDKFITWCISEIHDGVFPRLYTADELVLKIKQKEIDDYVEAKDKQLFIDDLCGRTCGFVFAEKYPSELGNRLCKMHPEIDFVAIINMDGIVSYRAVKDDIDLGKDIAQIFGGGGHPKAAGSQFSKEVQMEIIKKIFN
jgi:oligoribonuclease NrnB/cAMP/cGMP phosphodiesterase (DHH superfamily)